MPANRPARETQKGAPATDFLVDTAPAAPSHIGQQSTWLRLQRQIGNRAVGALTNRSSDGETAATADDALEQTIESARGNGRGLDQDVRRQMEGAIGADFSGVCIHTDARSNMLNRALSARAFTTGNDVFFGQGQYDPASSGGRELLAHELTHVVQQKGVGFQCKLEVSQPGDAMEEEADRVAEAVVRGEHLSSNAAARIGPTSGGRTGPVDRFVQRDKAEDLKEMAEAGEAIQEQQPDAQPPAMRVSNIGDAQAARQLVVTIEGYRGHMEEGSKAKGAFTVSPERVTPAKMAANEVAISALDDYLVDAGEQTRTLGSFQEAMRRARTNYARLSAQVTHLTVTNAVAGGTAGDIGKQIVQGAGFADSDAAKQRLQRAEADPRSSLAVMNVEAQKAHDNMTDLGQQVGQKQNSVSKAAYAYSAALNNFKTGMPSVNDNPEQAKELADLKERIEKVKKYVGKGLEYAGKALDKAGVKGAEKVGENAGPVVDFLTDQFYDAELNGIKSSIQMYNSAHTEHKISADLDVVKGASRGFVGALTDFKDTVEKFAHAQETFRTQLMAFGRMADAGHGDHFSRIAAVLAEVDTYELQLDEALRLAAQERAAAAEASNSRRGLEGGPNEGGARSPGLYYYQPYKTFHINGDWGFQCSKQEVRLRSLPTSRGSADGVANVGVNATIDKAIEDLQALRAEVDPMRRVLSQAMNLNMNSVAPDMNSGPAPTSRSAKTGL